jgi:hypothetical protein
VVMALIRREPVETMPQQRDDAIGCAEGPAHSQSYCSTCRHK